MHPSWSASVGIFSLHTLCTTVYLSIITDQVQLFMTHPTPVLKGQCPETGNWQFSYLIYVTAAHEGMNMVQ